ncbi:transcription initiation at TATA-containing promoter protein [Oleoguttula sp. CCFEE 5521]
MLGEQIKALQEPESVLVAEEAADQVARQALDNEYHRASQRFDDEAERRMHELDQLRGTRLIEAPKPDALTLPKTEEMEVDRSTPHLIKSEDSDAASEATSAHSRSPSTEADLMTPDSSSQMSKDRQRVKMHVDRIDNTDAGPYQARPREQTPDSGFHETGHMADVTPPCGRLARIQYMLEEVKRRIQEEAKLATLRSSLEATIKTSQAEEARLLLKRNELYAALALHQEQVHTKAAEIDAAMDATKTRRNGDEERCRHIETQIERLQTSALMQALALPESADSVPDMAILKPVEKMPINQKSYLQRQLTALRLYRVSEHFVWPDAGMSTDGRIVNEPMHLVMLEHNLCNDKYSSVSDLVNDFKLIAANARTHYGDDHDLTHAAMKMQERLQSMIEEMPAADKNLEACAPVACIQEGQIEDIPNTVPDEMSNDTSDGSRTVAHSDENHDHTAGAISRSEPPRTIYRSIRIGREWTISPKQWDKLSKKRRRSIDRARSILDTLEGQVATKTCEGCEAYDRACMVFKDHVRRERFAADETCALACGRCRMEQVRCSLQDDESIEVTASQLESGAARKTPPRRSDQDLETMTEGNLRKRKRTPSQRRRPGEAQQRA